MTFSTAMDHASQAFEAFAVLVLIIGLVWALAAGALAWRSSGEAAAYRRLRQAFGNVLLLALEVFVAADLIRTVAVSPSLTNVAVLGTIVLIRTFLSVSLEIEIEGALPWRRSAAKGPTSVP